ncbi:hypothetical protein FGADI_12395 [Fusarium gaditjirri]|uniref:Prion-inhibition and propagation HeLo domain-containing protein n=1 Tax=Fusarium gaditjirri TaxID=282569 RepID=A0A8H4WNT9_9HYPO|nr:hypothetical protein FGADI_12395 [Fusarium gaditjirri]
MIMSGLEVAGLAIGALSALAAFRGALDTVLLIESFFGSGDSSSFLAIRYHVEITRLDLWRHVFNIDDESKSPLKSLPDSVQNVVLEILAGITNHLTSLKKLAEFHDIDIPDSVSSEQNKTISAKVKSLSQARVKPKSRLRWTIRGRNDFEQQVSELSQLIRDLRSFTMDTAESQSLNMALPCMSLVNIDRADLLQSFQQHTYSSDAVIPPAAKAKLLYNNSTHSTEVSVTVVDRTQIQFYKNSDSCGTLRLPGQEPRHIWIEWTAVGIEDNIAAQRIKSLGCLLQTSSDPSLRLPVCHGIIDDVLLEAEKGVRQFGFLFGAPDEDQVNQLRSIHSMPTSLTFRYESDFRIHPPESLRDLIRSSKKNRPPMLGDRFALASALAIAFSRFHSAGWLHKGFRTDNIKFFAKNDDQTTFTDVTSPFITGFQYSRPTDAQSLSSGPLDGEGLEYYYHPSIDKGFTKRTDLYSLGVVLYEIGYWGLIEDIAKKRGCPNDRRGWYKFVVGKLLPDLGWRMGETYQSVVRTLLECRVVEGDSNEDEKEFFTEYFIKVIYPLDPEKY